MPVRNAYVLPAGLAAPLLLCILWVFAALPALAAEPDPLFRSADVLELTLTAPFGAINRARDKEVEYEGTLHYRESDGREVQLDVKLQVRGNFRLRPEICRFPQLWVNVRTGQAAGTLFENQDRIKLVTQCRRGERYAELIAKEQQVYGFFNQLSELSFATRGLRVTYVDSEDPDSSPTHQAFFVEHPERLASRFGMEEVELTTIGVEQLQPEQSSLVSLFMMMIGNTDYSLVTSIAGEECCHNAKLLVDASSRYFPIPYDFDASGFVDAPYAAPPAESLGINSNRQRLFRGYCVHQAIVPAAIGKMLATKAALLARVSANPGLSESTQNKSIKYLERFFEITEDQKKVESQIYRACRG